MPKVILDTNVLIDGVQDENSRTFKIIEASISGDLTPIISHRIKREYQRKAEELITDDEYMNLLEDFYEASINVHPASQLRIIEDDPDDNKFIEAAVEGGAEYIVSNDAHILDLSTYEDIRMVSPEEFWSIYVEDIKEDASEEWQEWTRMAGFS